MEENKIMDKELDEVSGGLEGAEAEEMKTLNEIRRRIRTEISDELYARIENAKGDVEVCEMLAKYGVNVEKLQRRIPDEYLNRIGGGYKNFFGTDIYCPECGNEDSDEISAQIIASITSKCSQYRCRKCGCFFRLTGTGNCVKNQ